MRTTKKIIASVLAVCMLASASVVGTFAASEDSSVGAETADTRYSKVNEAIDEEYTYDKGDLGATYTPEATTFKVWSPTATEVTLNRYATGSDSEAGAAKLGTVPMEKLMDGDKWTGVWTATVEGDLVNTYYTYTITSTHPYSGAAQTAETQDVNSVATGVNGRRSMVCDLSKTNPDGWENDSHVLLDKATDSTVWEIHVKDFSYDENSGVSDANRGKYLAFTETGTKIPGTDISTCIDYLKQLGITTVQINPFYDFQSINEAGSDTQFNWGYDPQNYNVPEGSYSSNPYDGNVRIKECKQMIQALHEAGLSVVMDVVYNHTFSNTYTDSCFQATVPDYYYRLQGNGYFSSGSGCGNDVASERAMVRDFIIRSCRYWVDEYHVDGFRFDLMGLMDAETINLIRDNLDEVDPRITMWGEGWTMASTFATKTCTGAETIPATQAHADVISTRVAFFNDAIRDGIKGGVFDSNPGFVMGYKAHAKDIRHGVRANSSNKNGWLAQAPSQTVSYAACHDNQTLYDAIILKSGIDKDYGVRDDTAVKMNKVTAAILYTSQGINFSLAGEEMARTKYGDENSYKSSPDINKIQWQNVINYADLISYYKGLNTIRKNFAPFTAADKTYDKAYIFNGTTLSTASNQVAFTVTNDQEGQWKKLAVIYNSADTDATVTLKDKTTTEWVIIADGDSAGVTSLGEVSGVDFTVPAYSSIIAVDKESFEANPIESNTGKVVVNYVCNGKNIVDSVILQGEIGQSYQTVASVSVPDTYVFDSVKGSETGKFTAETQTVTYIYNNYVPDSIKNADVDGNGIVNINDATQYQRWLAGSVTLSDEKLAILDFNYDGEKNISDVTMLQRALAGLPVSAGSVEVNYYYTDANGALQNLTDPVTITGRVGDDYTTAEYKVMGYTVDRTRYPDNASGKIAYSTAKVVNYYYVPGSLDVTLHVKHSGSEAWTPYFWIWGADLAGKDKGNYSGNVWPGLPASLNSETGWYDYSFTYSGAGTYNVIVSNNMATQTPDYKQFVENEMWIVIDDSKVSDKGDYLKFYTENPDVNPNAPSPAYIVA